MGTLKKFGSKLSYPLVILLFSILILTEVPSYHNHPARGADLGGYICAGFDALSLRDLYANSDFAQNNTWLPIFSFLAIPLALLSKAFGSVATKTIWFFVNFGALIWSIQMWQGFLQCEKISFLKTKGKAFATKFVLFPLIIVYFAVANNFLLLQINLIILLLMSLCVAAAFNKSAWKSGLFLALAISIKVFPGLLLIYFALKRQWKICGYTLLFLGILTIIPGFLYGFDNYITMIKHWMAIAHNYNLYDMRGPNNQSVYAIVSRLFQKSVSLATMKLMISGCIGITYLFSFTKIMFTRIEFGRNKNSYAEIALIILLTIIFSPIAWRHYWVLMLPASLCAFRRALEGNFKRFPLILYVSACLCMVFPELLSKSARLWAYNHGNYLVAALCLIFALALSLPHHNPNNQNS